MQSQPGCRHRNLQTNRQKYLPGRALTSAGYRHICSYPPGVQSLLVRVQTDAGIEGIGESHAPVAPQVTKAIIEHLLGPAIMGEDPRSVDVLWEKMYSTMRLRGHSTGFMTEAMAGIDIALWDIFGKSVGLPIYQLLGGGYSQRIKAYASGVPGTTRQERVDNSRRFVEEMGFTAVKASIGRNSQELEVAEMAALVDALGDEAHLLVDAHGAYDAQTATQLGLALQALGVYWFEDPLMPEDHAGYKQLADHLDMAVAAGETECNRYQFRDRLANRAVDIILPGCLPGRRYLRRFEDSPSRGYPQYALGCAREYGNPHPHRSSPPSCCRYAQLPDLRVPHPPQPHR